MKNRTILKLVSLALALIMVLTLAGCETQQLDEQPRQESRPAETGETSPVPETSGSGEDEFLDVDSMENTQQDLSKYDQENITVHKDKNGNIIISDGNQNGKDPYNTDAVPEGQQMPVEPGQIAVDTSSEKTCYLTISCASILDNMGDLEPGKEVLVPADGLLLGTTAVTFYEGESVFDILQRETRNRRIHMDSNFVPMYNSAYIKGIGNLYEFDCGDYSGWMFSVNGWYPNYGVSRYVVQEGDRIELNYTCDLGRDLPGGDWME